MYMTNMYKYEKDGFIAVSGTLPEGATLIEELPILYADENFTLVRISDGEEMDSVWLHDGDKQENYEERKKDKDGQGSNSNDKR